jgi:N6-adenosine-specific RNA methylase IME4
VSQLSADEAALVARARRLASLGKGQREIAAALGKSRHWVRYQTQVAGSAEVPQSPAGDAAAVKRLAQSIAQVGLRHPITVRRAEGDRYVLVAGRHRIEAYRKLGKEHIPAIISPLDDLEARLWEIDENLCRNELSPAERAVAISRRKAIYEQLHPETKHGAVGGGHEQSRQVGDSAKADRFTSATAVVVGQSERTIQREAHRGEVLGEEILARVAHTSLDKGEELDALALLGSATREMLADEARRGVRVSAKAELKKQERYRREAELGRRQRELPTEKFGVIVADPEWHDEVWSEETGMDRHAANHYPTSAAEVIKSRPVADIAADDCVLFLWTTNQHLRIAIEVMETWGSTYKSNYCWGKDRISLGRWQRGKHELLLIGTRGNPPCPAPGTQRESLISAPKGEHSAKPKIFLQMIEEYFPTLQKVELNCRGFARPGWMAWGNEMLPAAVAQ